ncbi:hypothetical protein EK21DRAFT_97298 [Setomelanomma holmii]|uniref:Alcohol dehydrogenase-like C-terminal domain-containing protein n=1 Tax=Setomelanomma holmii TaxID=210430 RepID=A0A9P4HKG8_9PLEO|nr:hypothetical protein EK21DRAFT_97298 [Setomelanomma holmii]
MSPDLTIPNTSSTPSRPGRWIVTEFGKPEVLKWESWDPMSELSGDDVLVRVITAGISGADNLQRAGGFPDPRVSKPGFTPGYEIVGEVLAFGESFDYIRSLGIEPIDRHAPNLVEQVHNLTNGQGVDVAYDCVCSEESVKNFLAATKADTGRLFGFGMMGEIADDGGGMREDAHHVFRKRLQKPRTSFFGLNHSFWKKEEGLAEFYDIVEKVRSGELDPVIARLLPLSKAVEAHQLLIDGAKVKGKMVFIVAAELAATVPLSGG